MLNPRAPPFQYSPPPPPPPALLRPQPPPFVEYVPPSFPWCPLSPAPHVYPPPVWHNFFVYLALRPPPPMLPLPSTEMSNLTIQGPQFKAQEAELHPDTGSSNLPPPPPAAAATITHFPKKKDVKTRYKKRWIPRAAQKNKQTEQVDPSLEFDEDSHAQSVDQRTTVMIRNIPNKLSRDMLLELLDKHCAEENKEAGNRTPSSAYDFVYLPIDFKNGCNLGYAFVNFTTAAAARRLYDALHRHKWMVFRSSKISHVCYARIQGRRALEEHFKYSMFRCDADEYFPAVLSPPRDGCISLPTPVPVGSRYRK